MLAFSCGTLDHDAVKAAVSLQIQQRVTRQ